MDLKDFLDNTVEDSEEEQQPINFYSTNNNNNNLYQTTHNDYNNNLTNFYRSKEDNKTNQRELNFLEIFIPKKKRKLKLKKFRALSDQATFITSDYLYYKKKYLENKNYTINLNEMFDTSKNLNVKRFLKQKEFEKAVKNNFSFSNLKEEKEINFSFKNKTKEIPATLIDWESKINNLQTNYNLRNNLIIDELLEQTDFEKKILDSEKNIKNLRPFPILTETDPYLVFEEKKNIKKTKEAKNFSKDDIYNLKVDTETFLQKRGVSHIKEALELSERIFSTKFSSSDLRNYQKKFLSIKNLFVKNEYKVIEGYFEKNNKKVLEDLSLKDLNKKFCLIEYLEQYPLIMQRPGMASVIETYYRKVNRKNNLPNVFNLESGDASPFLFNIKPNSMVNSLSNNLFKAPIFRQQTDLFLMIFDDKNDSVILREVEDLRLAGQIFPSQEIYSPNTRKFGIYSKNRLKVDLLNNLLFNKTNKSISLSQLDIKFPHFTEGQKRRLLKELCVIYKKGKENTYLLNQNLVLFRNDVLRLCSPENACQHEGLLFGEQRIKDKNFLRIKQEEDENNLSPWVLSKNYINSKRGRGMLELTGAGDPSKLGVCISFEKSKFNRDLDPKKYSSDALKEYRKSIDEIYGKMENFCTNNTKNFNIQKGQNTENESSKISEEGKKYLLIKRTEFNQKLNQNVITEEKVTDPEIIYMYLKMKKRPLKNSKSISEKKPLKCGACGEYGHMKTSKKCIKYIETAKKSPIEVQKSLKNLNNTIINCLNSLSNIRYVDPFVKPVPRNVYPAYYEVIESPICLQDMKNKGKEQKYRKFDELENDINLLINNCIKFNGPEHSYTKVAEQIRIEAKKYKQQKFDLIDFNEKILN